MKITKLFPSTSIPVRLTALAPALVGEISVHAADLARVSINDDWRMATASTTMELK